MTDGDDRRVSPYLKQRLRSLEEARREVARRAALLHRGMTTADRHGAERKPETSGGDALGRSTRTST
ncbi:MAG: hypothetical protein HY246_01075 [Proteobacteria bacterium]|nr:hypothetical protein [Pseudomonadota bacterium]